MLDKKAVSSAAASDPETQDTFLQIMGIIEQTELSGANVHFQVREEISEILAAANSRHYSRLLEKVPKTNGLHLQQCLDEMLRMKERGEYISVSVQLMHNLSRKRSL